MGGSNFLNVFQMILMGFIWFIAFLVQCCMVLSGVVSNGDVSVTTLDSLVVCRLGIKIRKSKMDLNIVALSIGCRIIH